MNESAIKLITAFGPFLVALITGLIAILAVRNQNIAMLKASKEQNDTTLRAMTLSFSSQFRSKRLEIIHTALSDVIMNLYLIERNSTNFLNNPGETFSAIAKLQVILTSNGKEGNIQKLLFRLMEDFIKRGDVANVSFIRAAIEKESSDLIFEIGNV